MKRQKTATKTATKTAIVIGTGAGGGVMAKELQGEYQVTILEIGKEFRPFSYPINLFAKFRKTGLFFDERLIRILLPNMVINKTKDMVLVRGFGKGGTTTLATGNAVRYDHALKEIGIDLDPEFAELYNELPITTDHQKRWTKTTRKMYRIFEEMGLEPVVTPKFLCAKKCIGCGHCAIGCPTNAKWDTRKLLDQAVAQGAKLVCGCKVTDLAIEDGKVKAVHARKGLKKVTYQADLVVLAAGGLGTPVILEKSGIPCEERLFVDPVLCVAGPLPGVHQEHQILMPFISQQDGYILSPYMDYLSFFFDKRWRLPMKNIASIMIKLADEEKGSIGGRCSAGACSAGLCGAGLCGAGERIDKTMSVLDDANMQRAVAQAREILVRLGVPEEKQFLGTLNAGHPGGMLPLTEADSQSLHPDRLPENLYVADATLFPKAMGNPPILTIMALAKKIAKVIKE